MGQQIWVLMLLSCTLAISFRTVISTSLADAPASDVYDVPNESIDQLIAKASYPNGVKREMVMNHGGYHGEENSGDVYDQGAQGIEAFYDGNSRFVKVEMDMVFPYEEYARLERLNNANTAEEPHSRAKRTSGIINGRGGGWRWTNNIVPYQFSRGFSHEDYSQLNAAIEDWEKYTCLDFQHRSIGNRIYFNGTITKGCYSRVGMVGGAQTIGLADDCKTKGVILHEIGHALGLYHEQSRPDRDHHVRIISGNIMPGFDNNFKKQQWDTILNMNIPYDYKSIMHYGKAFFAKNEGDITILTIDPQYQDIIGNRKGLSFRDIKSINIMYNCKRHTRSCTKNDSDCPGEGFVGKDCTCWCPGGSLRNPTKSCTGGTGGGTGTTKAPVTQRPTQRPTDCQDNHNACFWWAFGGECRFNPTYMHVNCKRSCNKCWGTGTGTSILASCRDHNVMCSHWASMGECSRDSAYMSANCRQSCNLCDDTSFIGSQGSWTLHRREWRFGSRLVT